jgi:putative cell wall-binding protein
MRRLPARILATTMGAALAVSLLPTVALGVAAPPNDAFASATAVGALPYYQTLDTTAATSESTIDGSAAALCSIPLTAATVWYTFTAPEARAYQVDVTDSSYAAGIVVVTGDPSAFDLVACRAKSVGFDLDAGTAVHILVYGTAGGGTLHLAVGFAPPYVEDQAQGAVTRMIPITPLTAGVGQGAAQTVKAEVTGRLVDVYLPLARTVTTTKALTVEIHATDPSGALLATSQPVAATAIPVGVVDGLPTSYDWIDVWFADPPTIAAGDTFAITVPTGTATASTDPSWGWGSTSAVYAAGSAWVANSTATPVWSQAAGDFAFDTYVEPLGWPDSVRYWGDTRFGTAADIGYNTFSAGVDIAYLANAYDFPDALAGAAAAGTVKGPVLLVGPNTPVDANTVAELKLLKPKKIAILGGTGVISDAVKAAVAPYAGSGGVVRYAGATRFGTAGAISLATFPTAGSAAVAYIATAYDFPDALAGAAAAGTVKGPILLAAATGTLDASTKAELLRLKPAKVIALGGTGVISADVYTQLTNLAFTHTMARYAGATRFETAATISANTFTPGGKVAYAAYAYNFPDALAGAAAAGTVQGPVLLVATNGPIGPTTGTELGRLDPKRVVVLGGTGVISDAVMTALGGYATGP